MQEKRNVYEVMQQLSIELPPPRQAGGVYTQVKFFGENYAYVSGCAPIIPGKDTPKGKVGRELEMETAQDAAKRCILNMLKVLENNLGSLNRVKKMIKMLAFVSSDDGFYDQPKVINPASQMLIDIFGEECGKCARSAVGVNVLPSNIPVEIEMLLEIYPN